MLHCRKINLKQKLIRYKKTSGKHTHTDPLVVVQLPLENMLPYRFH